MHRFGWPTLLGVSSRGDMELELAEAFGRVARSLGTETDAETTLGQIVHLAVETLDACEHAGISYVEHGAVKSGPSTGPIPAGIGDLQSEIGEGPCLDAITQRKVVTSGCLSEEDRWPAFANRAHAESGMQSVLAVPLVTDHETMGAINLYSSAEDAFDQRDVALALIFSIHAAVALARSRERQQLERKVASRQSIGEAVGILMAHHRITEPEAFELMRSASQRLNVRVQALAEDVVRTGEMPAEPTDPSRSPGGR